MRVPVRARLRVRCSRRRRHAARPWSTSLSSRRRRNGPAIPTGCAASRRCPTPLSAWCSPMSCSTILRSPRSVISMAPGSRQSSSCTATVFVSAGSSRLSHHPLTRLQSTPCGNRRQPIGWQPRSAGSNKVESSSSTTADPTAPTPARFEHPEPGRLARRPRHRGPGGGGSTRVGRIGGGR